MAENENPEPAASRWSEWSNKLSVLKTLGAVLLGGVIGWTALQSTVTSQAFAITRLDEKIGNLDKLIDLKSNSRDKQLEEIRKAAVSKELFEERTNTILREIQSMRQEQKNAIERIEDRPSYNR